jgi:hypothetical protein
MLWSALNTEQIWRKSWSNQPYSEAKPTIHADTIPRLLHRYAPIEVSDWNCRTPQASLANRKSNWEHRGHKILPRLFSSRLESSIHVHCCARVESSSLEYLTMNDIIDVGKVSRFRKPSQRLSGGSVAYGSFTTLTGPTPPDQEKHGLEVVPAKWPYVKIYFTRCVRITPFNPFRNHLKYFQRPSTLELGHFFRAYCN